MTTLLESGRWSLRRSILWALCCPLALFALNPDRKADSYTLRSWFTEHGLPSNKVRAIAQATDGYLWIATAQGLARFDGSRFTAFTGATHPELRGGGFFAVAEAPDGSMWFGGDNGLFRWHAGQFQQLTAKDGLADNYVRTLTVTRDGTMVAGTLGGYSLIRDGRVVPPGDLWRRVTGTARAYLERADGSVWLGTEEGLWRIAGGSIERLSGRDGLPQRGFISLLESRDGALWIGHQTGVRVLQRDGAVRDFGSADGIASARVASLLQDRHGSIWIASLGGLYRLAHGRLEAATRPDDKAGITTIQQLFEDREGAVWVASAVGLFRLEDNVASTIGVAEGLRQAAVYSVLEASDGAWWIGPWGGGVHRYAGGRATPLERTPSLNLDQIISFAEDTDGSMWIGAVNGLVRHTGAAAQNFFRREEADALRRQLAAQPDARLPGLAHGRVNAIAPDGAGRVWVATDGALYHGGDAGFRAYTKAHGLPGNVFKSVLRARNGDVWTSVPPHGVARLREGAWTTFTCGREISKVYPRGIYEDAGGAIWVMTDGGGLNRFKDGRWRVFTTQDGLADNFVSGMVEDNLGYYWIAFPRGVMRVARAEFESVDAGRLGTLRPRIFDRFDGLPAAESNQQGSPSATRTRDGRLLFATDRGVAVIEPHHVVSNSKPPPVYIEEILVEGAPADLSRPVVVPPGSHDLEIRYTAICLLAPEKVRFKVRLSPLDSHWEETTRRDVRYARLPPGNYTFEVLACNNDGVWNEQGRAIAFRVRPHFHQTGWFLGLGLALAGGGVFAAFFLRARLARRRMAVLQQLVDERTREIQGAREAAEAAVAEHQRAENELRWKTALLEAQMDASPDGILVVDNEGRRIVQNRNFGDIWGIPRAIAEDRDSQPQVQYVRALAKDTDRFVEKILHLYANPDQTSRDEIELKDGRFIDRYSSPVRGRDGARYGRIWTVRDITEQKRAHAAVANSLSVLHATLESTADGILVTSREGRMVTFNHKFASMWRVPEKFLAPGHDRKALAIAATQLKAPGAFLGSVRELQANPDAEIFDVLEFKDGRVFERYSQAQRMGGTSVGRVWCFRDITQRKQAEAKLDAANRQLIETSRQAGMAEVATGVLHNVGNVLNSVNVAATILHDNVRQSKVAKVTKLSELIESQRGDLAKFFAEDSRGQQVPAFLQALSTHLSREQAGMLKELEVLRKNIEHINDIVAMQQSYAKVSGVAESVGLTDLVEDALRMNAGALVRHDVSVERIFEINPTLVVEKHKVLQILVNVIRNAKYACDDSGRGDKRITLRVYAEAGRARVAVIDNGVGIPAENLTRIFSHGFTTRKNGHGFGLHSGALAAKELGGALIAQSDGPGQGATFILELPINSEAKAA